MFSDPTNVFLIIVASGALVFTGYLILDYFSHAAVTSRRRRRRYVDKLKKVREHQKERGAAESASDSQPERSGSSAASASSRGQIA